MWVTVELEKELEREYHADEQFGLNFPNSGMVPQQVQGRAGYVVGD